MLRRARRYFAQQDLLEVDVPFLSSAAVSDPNIASLEVTTSLSPGTPRFLHTSPEYAMKRLLAAQFPDIFFIGRVFRDGEAGRHHQPEFTMIEWYRRDYALDDIIADSESLLTTLLGDDALPEPSQQITYREAFTSNIGVDPLTASLPELIQAATADDELQRALGDDRNAWLDLLLSTRVATAFPQERLTIVTHYPASQAALARLTPGDSALADRFEVFAGACELANGYVELTDSEEQRRRFTKDQDRRRSSGAMIRAVDDRLLAALEAGLPPCAGVAVGFDRVVALALGVDDIRDVYHFPWS